jgi:dihydroorotate dehydrogenase (NAD+) catalytic subunit
VRCVHELARSIELPVVGVGGIGTAEHALEYIMAGATAVQVGSAVRNRGRDVFSKLATELASWLDEHGHASVNDVRNVLAGGAGG